MSGISPVFLRPFLRTAALVAALGMLVSSCATKPDENPDASPTPSPTPASEPSQTPTPEPTPLPSFRITVTTEDGQTQETIVTPEPTPAQESDEGTTEAAPSEVAAPTPTPSGNFLSRTWQKIFPPRQPKPGAPPPTLDMRPREGFFARMWHSVFPPKEQPPPALPPNWLGTVKLVNERDKYVLIDSQGFVTPPVGQLLTTVSGTSETGSLRISADRDPPFFIADILSGKPEIGNKVYSPDQ